MKTGLALLVSFILGASLTYLLIPRKPVTPKVTSVDSEKNMPDRDLANQYQKFYDTFENFENWDAELKSQYLKQNHLTEEYLTITRKYFQDSIKAGKSIKVEQIK